MRAVPVQRRLRVAVAASLAAAVHAGLLGWFAVNASAPSFPSSGEHVPRQPQAVHIRWMETQPTSTAAPASTGVATVGALATAATTPLTPGLPPKAVHRPGTGRAITVAETAEGAIAPIGEPLEAASPGAAFDVPPIPREGWIIDAAVLASLPPGGPPPVVQIEVDVDHDGAIVGWQLLQTNANRDNMLALLHGIETTAMVPALKDGKPVGARFTVEFAFSD